MTGVPKWPCLVAALGVFAGVSLSVASPAHGDTVPFQDENQYGTLTFCNQDRQPVTSGSLDAVPFVWNAVSSTPAPAHYTRAYLDIYQPNQYEDASDWTGSELTDPAVFSNPAHPMAEATYADSPLLWADQELPPYWDGLYELRMYFSQPSLPFYSSKYPAAVIRVTGNKWTLVSGGGGSCDSGTAVSIELSRLPKSETEVAHVLSSNGKDLVAASSSPAPASAAPSRVKGPKYGKAASPTSVSSATAGASAPSTSSEAGRSGIVAGGKTSSSSGRGPSGVVISAIAAVGAVFAAAGVLFFRRRRRKLPGSSSEIRTT